MKIRIVNLLIFSVLSSCENHQQSEDHSTQVIEETKIIPNTPKEKPVAKTIMLRPTVQKNQIGQNPNKSFNDIQANVIQGRAKFPFPQENFLK